MLKKTSLKYILACKEALEFHKKIHDQHFAFIYEDLFVFSQAGERKHLYENI